jgi:hypothetical protein
MYLKFHVYFSCCINTVYIVSGISKLDNISFAYNVDIEAVPQQLLYIKGLLYVN